jgi:hypothetical protein
MLVSTALVGATGLILTSVLVTTMRLSGANAVTNISNYRSRQTLDRLDEIVRFATDTPVLINSDGTAASGTTSDGILVKNALFGPYIFKNVSGNITDDIPSGATSFMVEYVVSADTGSAKVPDWVPQVGDYFSLNISTKPELEVTAVTSASNVLSGTTTISRSVITTRQGTTEKVSPNAYTITGSRYRKEAYVFVQSGSQWYLRHYPRVTATTNYALAPTYVQLGTGFQKLSSQAWFTTTTDSGTQASWLRAVARSSDHAEATENSSGHNTLTTMPLQIKLWNYNAPPTQ